MDIVYWWCRVHALVVCVEETESRLRLKTKRVTKNKSEVPALFVLNNVMNDDLSSESISRTSLLDEEGSYTPTREVSTASERPSFDMPKLPYPLTVLWPRRLSWKQIIRENPTFHNIPPSAHTLLTISVSSYIINAEKSENNLFVGWKTLTILNTQIHPFQYLV